VRVDGDTFALLERCLELTRASGGAFDVTVGGLMDALGFHASDAPAAACGADALLLDPERASVRFARPGLSLDLGGVAKGHALDLAASVLREHGVERALLHGGTSTAIALGAPPGADAWRVAIGRGPDAPIALLRDAALSVSATGGRRNDAGAPHVLDPRTGLPVDERVSTAAVIAPSARDADAWSTALLAGAAPPDDLATWTAPRGTVHGSCPPPSRFELTPQTSLDPNA
jgi:thiamine biosynthesis lipoprotein